MALIIISSYTVDQSESATNPSVISPQANGCYPTQRNPSQDVRLKLTHSTAAAAAPPQQDGAKGACVQSYADTVRVRVKSSSTAAEVGRDEGAATPSSPTVNRAVVAGGGAARGDQDPSLDLVRPENDLTAAAAAGKGKERIRVLQDEIQRRDSIIQDLMANHDHLTQKEKVLYSAARFQFVGGVG